jgi:hypothetical protein
MSIILTRIRMMNDDVILATASMYRIYNKYKQIKHRSEYVPTLLFLRQHI